MAGSRILRALAFAAGLGALAAAAATFAENADPNNDMSQYAWGENVGWINAEPSGQGGPGVQVSGLAVTGYMWGENIGWINMSCTNNGTCGTTGNYGVTNDNLGNLGGYAWGENVGWISFSCKNTNACATSNYGVTIDPNTGVWAGYAWGENIGWISFSDTTPVAYKVQTDDGDGVPGATDNCDFDANPLPQANTDAVPLPNSPQPADTTVPYDDGFGDVCDPDDDNDRLPDANEGAGCNGGTNLNSLLADTDGDRSRDGAECALGSNPNNAGSKPAVVNAGQGDADGLSDAFEASIGSNPNANDTDGDGILDGVEYRGYSTSPTDTDTDDDGCVDDIEVASVNGDKAVNAIDLSLVATFFNSTTKVNYDLTKDGSINVLDLLVIATNFGACPA